MPNHVELQTIRDCASSPCIDEIFGPTAATFYWSASTDAGDPNSAWIVCFDSGCVTSTIKLTVDTYVRAVRAGSCN